MKDVNKILYMVVVDNEENDKKFVGKESFRYTRSVLQNTLQFMGCKSRYAVKVNSFFF